jgi:DNA invertase Pin-like site-specific DNA recombinase
MPLVRASETETASSGRAATYVRVSTGQQRYSIENQAAALAAYAARRSISIVRTYRDQGRSGVRIAGRDGLQDLIQDVQSERADFDCILVYDVSRWGRFQDVDESAYYEFICKRAGIKVHYCADEFENDGSLASIVLKNLKRVAAADFSRQLSKKVFLGQCRVATQGYWRGGPAGYGLRRLLVDESGKPKTLLQYGQRKNLKSERVILVPGPKPEVKIVQRIFASFAIKKKTRTEIAAELNAGHIPNARGMPWSVLTVSNTLKNEAYIGNLVYNRRSQKLGERQVKNPPDMWIRRDNAFKPIVSPALFAKAKKILVELENGRTLSDKELLDKLKSLWRRKGHLSLKIMLAAKSMPNPTLYTRRFGSLTGAYKRIGFKPESRYNFTEHTAKIDGVVCSVAADIIAAIEKRGTQRDVSARIIPARAKQKFHSVSDGGLARRKWEDRAREMAVKKDQIHEIRSHARD